MQRVGKMKEFNKFITGNRIRNLRETAAETQGDLAELLGVKRQIVSYYENGTRVPSMEHLISIASHYNTTTDYLLGLTKAPTTNKDIRFVCDYTGFKDNVIESFVNNPVTVKLLNDLFSDDEIDCLVLFVNIEAYKRKHQHLIDFMEQTINNKSKWKSEKDLETLAVKHQDLIESYQLTEYQVQKIVAKLLKNYCKNEADKIAELQNDFDEIIHKLVIKYGETYDD